MSDVQIEVIVKAAVSQAEHQVEACVVFLDTHVGAALADLVIDSHRWAICVADEYVLLRALGAALRFPDLEIVAAVYVDEKNRRLIERCSDLAEEMAVTNVSIFGCGPAAEAIDGMEVFDCPARARVCLHPWQACPLHTQQFSFSQDDSTEPALLLKRIRKWAQADSLIEIWDAQEFGDATLTLMLAAQYAAQGRQVWTLLDPRDLSDPEIISVARAIGQAQLPLKCLCQAPLPAFSGLPWSHWARLRGWWLHMPVDAEEGLSWMQSSVDHMWPTLMCLPQRWLPDLQPLRFACSRRYAVDEQPRQILCMPHQAALASASRAALAAMDVMLDVQVISSLAPLSQLQLGNVTQVCVLDDGAEAPLSDLLLPQLSGRSTLQVAVCGPQQCQGQQVQAADVAALMRRLSSN